MTNPEIYPEIPSKLSSLRIQQDDFILSKIKIENVKSISQIDLPLRNLNVVLGSNSAGKSTILQCLALLAQNSAYYGRSNLALNGTLVKLGSFDEFKQRGSEFEPLIEIELTSSGVSRRQFLSTARAQTYHKFNEVSFPIKITAGFRLAAVESNKGSASIKAGSLTISGNSEETKWNWEEISASSETFKNHRFVRFTNGDIGYFDESKNALDLVPTGLLRYQKYNEWLVSNLKYYERAGTRLRSRQGVNSRTIEANLFSIIFEHGQAWQKITRAPLSADIYLHDYIFGLYMSSVERSKVDYFRTHVKYFEQGELEEVVDSQSQNSPLREGLMLLPVIDGSFFESSIYSHASKQVTDFFRKKIHYLGPLRLEPAALQKQDLEPSANAPVGIKGEYFGYQLAYGFLSRQKNNYPRPRNLNDKEQTLVQAVQEWMKWIQLGDEIRVLEEGIEGLQARTDNETLYQKGTGLSQIIPVLVLGLASQPGSLTLIEQPELHLHPAVQQKLGDFLMQMSKSGRHFLVESHSEYLVTRLRKLVFVDGENSSNVAIVFATKLTDESGEAAKTSLSIAEITSSGELDSWPKGFFDFVNDDEADILMKRFIESP